MARADIVCNTKLCLVYTCKKHIYLETFLNMNSAIRPQQDDVSCFSCSEPLLQRRRWISSNIEPLKEGIGNKYTVWPAVELGRRLLLLLFIVAYPRNDVSSVLDGSDEIMFIVLSSLLQYPAIFILMVFVAAFGYLQPYKHLLTNILEIVLSINVLTMLLLRNTKTLTEGYQALEEQDGQSDDECNDQFDGVTDLAILLGTFYYFPLVVFPFATVVWVFASLRQVMISGFCKMTIL